MSVKNSITCDQCGSELIVDSSYPHKFTLQLSCIDTGINTSGSTFAVAMYPLLKEPHHFCDFKCLEGWMEIRKAAR